MPVCSANGLYYEWSGLESGAVLIFSNSLGTTLEMWEPQVQHFGDRYRILRYDTRGHGRSEVTPGPYTLEGLGQDVLALAAALGVKRAAFCGLSLGGVVGQWLAAQAPQLVQKVILCDTAARIGTHEMWNQRIATAENQGMQAIAAGIPERWFTRPFVDREPQTVADFQQMVRATSPVGYAACCVALREADMHPYLPTIRIPSLILYGDQDPVTTAKDAQVLAQQIPGASLAGLSASHISNVEAATQFNEHLDKFLSESGR